MKVSSIFAACFTLLAVSLPAQEKKAGIIGEGGNPDDRGSARVLYWNQGTDSSAGWFAINYGRPVWKKDYEDRAKFDTLTKGKVWRLGSNYWTVLDTSLPLRVSGKSIRVGSYFLGLRRSADGSKWSLAFIDPAKVRRARIDAFEIEKASVSFEAPMTEEKTHTTVEKLTITLSYPKENPKKVSMKVAWGNWALTAPIEVTLAE